jgi:hypothetical protein
MTLSNWIGLAVVAVILIVSISLLIHYKRKFKRMDGFEGIVTERGEDKSRASFDWEAELKKIQSHK